MKKKRKRKNKIQEHFKPSQETQTTNRDLKLSELVFETALQRATAACWEEATSVGLGDQSRIECEMMLGLHKDSSQKKESGFWITASTKLNFLAFLSTAGILPKKHKAGNKLDKLHPWEEFQTCVVQLHTPSFSTINRTLLVEGRTDILKSIWTDIQEWTDCQRKKEINTAKGI